MPHIKIYTTSWCAFCRAEKQYLDEHSIPYEAIDVEANQAAAEEMIHISGQTGVPVTVITPEDGKAHPEVIIGFDQDRLDEILGL